MNDCTFCKELLKTIDDEEYYNNPHEHTVALISRRYFEGEVCGLLTHSSKPLNFCPVCGKKLNLEQITKEIRKRYEK